MNNLCLRTAVVGLAFALAAASPLPAMYHDKGYGEPYRLDGKRIVFTTWYWVRPGQPDWRDDEGKSVYADEAVMADPYDSHFVNLDAPWGVRLIVEPADPRGKLEIKPEHPWEAGGITITQLLPLPDGRIKAWGTCIDENGKENPCYFESADGFNWERPSLGLVDYAGGNENNLIPERPHGYVFIDPNGPPEERYKSAANGDLKSPEFEKLREKEEWRDRPWSIMASETDPGRVHAIFGYVSPDGFSWKKLEEPLSIEISDGDQAIYWDSKLRKYVMYMRAYLVGPRAENFPLKHERRHQFISRRAIGRSETADFRAFPLSELVIETANDMAPNDTFYLNARTTIPRAPEFHLMFPSRYIQAEDNTAVDVYTSYDGKSWHIAPGSPILRTADFGGWNGGCVWMSPHLIERSDGSWLTLYRGDNFPHKYPRGKRKTEWGTAVWEKGRLMAIEAPEDGFFATPALLAPGTRLRINALTSRVGEILVEAADFNGVTLPGRSFDECVPIVGDQFATEIRWNNAGDLGVSVGEPLVLRFRMRKAKIYGLDFE